jgi:hypothetical protein
VSAIGSAVATRDQQLRARAFRVIPGGIYGHQSAATLPPAFPQFMVRDIPTARRVAIRCETSGEEAA